MAIEFRRNTASTKVKPRTPQEVNVDIDHPGNKYLIAITKKTFSASARRRMYERLASPIEAGVPIKSAISQLYQRAAFKSETETQAIVLRNVLYTLNNGEQVSDGLYGFVPLNELLLLRAGEEKGDLSSAMFRAADAIEAQSKVKSAIKKSTAKPIMLLVVLMIAMYVIGAHVAPQMDAILPMDQWRGQAAFVAKIATVVNSLWFPIILASLIGFLALILYSQKRAIGGWRTHADNFPPYSLYRVMQGASWLTTYSAMLQSGRRVESILTELLLLSEKDKNYYLADRTRKILIENAAGAENIGIAMERAGTNFPDNELIADLVMQSSLTNFDERIDILARRWIDNAVVRVESIAAVMNVVALLLLSTFIGGFVMGVIALNQQIASSLGGF